MSDLSNLIFGNVTNIDAQFVANFVTFILICDVIKSVINVIGGLHRLLLYLYLDLYCYLFSAPMLGYCF